MAATAEFFLGVTVIILSMLGLSISYKRKPTKTRVHLSDVKENDYIFIEHRSGIGKVKCLNNDPKTKKILLVFTYTDDRKEALVLNYNDIQLRNFHLLNSVSKWENDKPKKDDDNNGDISSLQKKLNEALENEEYEKAQVLQNKIDKLLKK
jgi:hypothetical protein